MFPPCLAGRVTLEGALGFPKGYDSELVTVSAKRDARCGLAELSLP